MRPLVVTQLLRLPSARKLEITCFLAQGKCRSCVITNSLNILWVSVSDEEVAWRPWIWEAVTV